MVKDFRIASAYCILSGLFRFDHSELDGEKLLSHYVPWSDRLNHGNPEPFFIHLKSVYYDSFLKNIFPEVSNREQSDTFSTKQLNHLTLKRCLEPDNPLQITLPDEEKLNVPFIDLYLFPSGIGIFSMKLNLNDLREISIDKITRFIFNIRQLDTIMHCDSKERKMKQFIAEIILPGLKLPADFDLYTPLLKSYLILDLHENLTEQQMNHLLYDAGNLSPVGTAEGKGDFAPAKEYYERQLSENKISIFKNWSALCLFDTFTRISLNYPDKFNSWENEQFNIYIHSLYLKFYMYLANTQISHITEVSGETQKIRDGFVQFINEYYMSHISYKWLANEIHDKLLIGLDAKGELEKMEVKIKRINEYFREKRSKRLNRLLLTIALISIISVFLNSWNLKKLGAYFPRVIEYLSEIFNNLL